MQDKHNLATESDVQGVLGAFRDLTEGRLADVLLNQESKVAEKDEGSWEDVDADDDEEEVDDDSDVGKDSVSEGKLNDEPKKNDELKITEKQQTISLNELSASNFEQARDIVDYPDESPHLLYQLTNGELVGCFKSTV